jgi:branched-chain amino acid transport system permease protein
MVSPSLFLQLLLNGILLGGLYALLGSGLSLCFGVLKFFNILHGSLILLSCYFTYSIFASTGLDPIIASIILIPAYFFVGFFLRRYLIGRLATLDAVLIVGFSLTTVLKNIVLLIWGARPRGVYTSYSMLAFDVLGGVRISFIYLLCFILSLVGLFSLHLLLKKTFLGKAIRAVAQDPETASAFGINPSLIKDLTFGISLSFIALTGGLMSTIYSFDPTLEIVFLTKSICVVVIGGLGSVLGTIVGGVVLGLAECFAGIAGAQYQAFVAAVIFLIIVLIKPKGFFGLYVE